MTRTELIDLAKECGGFDVHKKNLQTSLAGHVIFTDDQLAAYTNAVIERCADEIKHKVYAQDAECAIRAMKVQE